MSHDIPCQSPDCVAGFAGLYILYAGVSRAAGRKLARGDVPDCSCLKIYGGSRQDCCRYRPVGFAAIHHPLGYWRECSARQ